MKNKSKKLVTIVSGIAIMWADLTIGNSIIPKKEKISLKIKPPLGATQIRKKEYPTVNATINGIDIKVKQIKKFQDRSREYILSNNQSWLIEYPIGNKELNFFDKGVDWELDRVRIYVFDDEGKKHFEGEINYDNRFGMLGIKPHWRKGEGHSYWNLFKDLKELEKTKDFSSVTYPNYLFSKTRSKE